MGTDHERLLNVGCFAGAGEKQAETWRLKQTGGLFQLRNPTIGFVHGGNDLAGGE